MFGFFKKKEEKPKTLDQLSPDELKEFQRDIKKQLREATRSVDREVFNADRLIRSAKRDLEKKVKEKCPKNVLKIYAKNVLSA